MTIPARKYLKADSDRLELNVKSVEAMMAKFRLTPQDLLVGLRYCTPLEKWNEALGAAIETCVMYDRYHNVDPEETIERYGEEV